MKKINKEDRPYEDYFEVNDQVLFKALNGLLKKSWKETHEVVGFGSIKSEKLFSGETEDKWIVKIKKKNEQ